MALAFLVTLSASSPSLAQSSGWDFAVNGGYVSGYTHQHIPGQNFLLLSSPARSASLPGSWTGSVSASRPISKTVSLRVEGGYMQFEGDFESLAWRTYRGTTPTSPPTGTLGARFVTLGVGPRFTRSVPGWRTRVFLDAAPLAVWSEHESDTEWTESGGPPVREHRSARVFLPGLTLGAGFGGPIGDRLGYEIGIRYLRSADPDTRAAHDTYYATDLKGLSTFVIAFGVSLTP